MPTVTLTHNPKPPDPNPNQAAATQVKKLLPALLVGPEGAFDSFATSLALLPQPQAASNASRKKPRSK